MSKIVKTIVTERRIVPVEYLAMVSVRRNAGAIRSKKDYSRKEKHRGSIVQKELEA